MAQESKKSKRQVKRDGSSSASPATPSENSGSPGPSAFKLRGAQPAAQAPSEIISFLKTKEVTIKPKAEFVPGLARGDSSRDPIDVAHDDLIEIEFDSGERLWLRGEDYYARCGGPAARGGAEGEPIEVTDQLALLPPGMQSRGLISWAVKSLKVLGIDLAGKTAELLAKTIEERVPEDEEAKKRRPGPGLYHCAMVTDEFSLTPATPDGGPNDSPYLVFIHGTGSSTWGSFGDLWSKERQAELGALRAAYGNRVLAFNHASLTQSPIKNALDLVQKLTPVLPEKAKLHLLTQSRGGLVGELLCRAWPPQTAKKKGNPRHNAPPEYQLFESGGHKYPNASEQLDLLKQLDAELKRGQFTVERFVRVACPALGTTLASGRLDRWLSVIGTLAGKALPNTPLFDTFEDIGDFVAAVIKERTDPSTLPGLEAVMPESALIKLINWPNVTVPGVLAVISGDIDPGAWWARLLVWVSDRFYEGDHDLVVNTVSMYGGANRSGKSVVSFNKGPEVNHFRYFQNSASAQRIVQALTAKGDGWEGFEPLQKPTVEIPRAVELRITGPRPVVFVIPGIMGNELQVGNDHVWLDIPELTVGGFTKLGIDAKDVRPTGPFASYYGKVIKFLAQTHRVAPFPYDWRLPVEKEADRLADEVKREFDEAKQYNMPVRILAHSTGGLVARAMIVRHESLWRDVCSVPGARMVMLGTPNGGSHAITELLVGQSSTLRKLALLDIKHNTEDLLGIISRFPGLLAMLPVDNREDYFSVETWKNYHEKAGSGWVLPTETDIAGAREFRQLVESVPVDPKCMVYVAGCADVTIAEMFLDTKEETPQIKFLATARGDGRVTWDSGIPPGVPTWYMNVEHGDLAAHEDAFPALGELLSQGATSLLPQGAPISRAAATLFPMPPAADELYPDRDVLAATVIGAGSRRRPRTVPLEPPVQVRVLHGNLAYASYPLAVGHYAGDTIISAEKELDRALSKTLSQRHRLGIYPGKIETSAIFVNPKLASLSTANPKGAIVIGLGAVGSLSAAMLARTVTRALLEYATEWSEHGLIATEGMAAQRSGQLGVSALLIGTGGGGISVTDSVFAFLTGVKQANRALTRARHTHTIRNVEFIELYEDRALQAVKALRDLEKKFSTKGEFVFGDAFIAGSGGLHRVTYDESSGWWQRLQILGGKRDGEPDDGSLRFSASTRRARSEVRLHAIQRALVDQFIAESICTTRDYRAGARTLFELLLPNEIKQQAPDQDNIVLILDEEAAHYPWELLEDRWSDSGNPLVIEHGLLRQLESGEFRESVLGVTTPVALVIGDPISKFPELKGAQEEAGAVARTLQSVGAFQTKLCLRPTSKQVISALFEQDYRVLHLAGHGIYRFLQKKAIQCESCGQPLPEEKAAQRQKELKPVTGMIIGDDVVLSPQEVHQMRHVPELVFINCCYLGYIEADAKGNSEDRNVRNDYNKIAANVATEFIRMGVRAVVAAGWAVDDAAASTFAVTFYEAMLKGNAFGDAVTEARKATHQRHGQSNTWGAYQCYGDPGYRLVRKTDEEQAASGSLDPVSPSEAVTELNNTAARLATQAGQDPKETVAWIKAILKVVEEKKWLNRGEVCAALGRAFAEAKCFAEAVTYYEQALKAENAAMTIKDFEQLANVQSRQAVALWKAGKQAEAEAAIEAAIRRLESIQGALLPTTVGEGEETDRGVTVERLSLLGSAYKRKAWVSKADDREGPLGEMKEYYKKAFQLAENKGRFNAYPLLNWLTAEIVMAWQSRADRPAEDNKEAKISEYIRRAESELKAALGKQREFWTEIMLADAALIETLAMGFPEKETIVEFAERYLETRKIGSPREFESTLDQIDFLAAMAESRKPLAAALAQLRQLLK